MKHPVITLFVAVGVAFVSIVIAVVAYVVLAKPFESELLDSPSTVVQPQEGTGDTSSNNPLLTPAQEAALQNFGVNTAALPTSISPEQMSCAIAALGEDRVRELVAGAQITLSDVYNARGCL